MKLTESKIKQIIKEELGLMEALDPTSIMAGAACVTGLYALYKIFFEEDPSSEEQAVERIKQHVLELEAKVSLLSKNNPYPPPPQDSAQAIAKTRLAQLKARRQKNKDK